MRRLVLLVSFVMVAGCAAGGPPPVATEGVSVGFPPRGLADTIAIHAVDRLPLRAASLIAPDGSATPAPDIDVNPAPSFRTSQDLGNDPYAGNVFGVGNVGGTPGPALPQGGAAVTETRVLVMVSDASIALPDPVAYRRDWRRYRIRLLFGTPPAPPETRELPAPAPPNG